MTDCAAIRTSLGVYVLGAIEAAERTEVEEHLGVCPVCRDELAGLAALPALLGRVDEAQVGELGEVPPEPLEALLTRAGVERRRNRGRLWRRAPLLAAAAVVLVVVGGLSGAALVRSGESDPPAAAPSTSVSGPSGDGPAPERLTATGPDGRVTGHVLLHREAWGTRLELRLTGVPKGSACSLRVVARDGQRDVLGSWNVPSPSVSRAPSAPGKYTWYSASTRFTREALESFEIVTLDGRSLLTIPA